MEPFALVFFATLPIACAALLLFVHRPLHAAMFVLVYRSIFSVAAYLHMPGIGGIPFFVPVFVMLWLVCALHFAFVSPKLPPAAPMATFIVLCAAMIAGTACAIVASPGKAGEFSIAMLKFILPVAVYWAACAGLRTERDFRKLPALIAAFLLVPTIAGLLQSATGVSYDYATDTFMRGIRPVGTIIDPNAYGIFLCMGAFLVAPAALVPGNRGMKALLLALVLGILLARNRGSWICAGAATAIGIALFRRHFNMMRILATATLLALIAAPVMIARFADLQEVDRYGQSQDTFSERLAQSQHLLGQAMASPFIGYGAGSAEQPWGDSAVSRPPHDDYVRMIYEFGFPIALFYGMFLFHQLYTAWRPGHFENWELRFSATCFILYVIMISTVQNLIYDSIMYSTIMLMLAITHRQRHLNLDGEAEKKKPSP